MIKYDNTTINGRWIERKDWTVNSYCYSCSICGNEIITFDKMTNDDLWNFCPHCGKMMEISDG